MRLAFRLAVNSYGMTVLFLMIRRTSWLRSTLHGWVCLDVCFSLFAVSRTVSWKCLCMPLVLANTSHRAHAINVDLTQSGIAALVLRLICRVADNAALERRLTGERLAVITSGERLVQVSVMVHTATDPGALSGKGPSRGTLCSKFQTNRRSSVVFAVLFLVFLYCAGRRGRPSAGNTLYFCVAV